MYARINRGLTCVVCAALGWIFSQQLSALEWTEIESGTNEHIRGVVFADGKFVAVGDNGLILTSPDGQSWKRRDSTIDKMLSAVAFGDGMFVATVGDRG